MTITIDRESPSLGALLLALVLSLAVVAAMLTTGSAVMPVAVGFMLAVGAWLFLAKSPVRRLLFLVFLLAPVDMTKAILTPTDRLFGADAPGLAVSAMDIAILAWAFVWLWRRTTVEKRRLRLTSLDIAALLFLSWIWFSAFRSPAGALAFATAVTYSKFVFYFIFVSHALKSSEDWRTVLRACVTIFAIQAIYVAAQLLTQSPLTLPGIKAPETAIMVSLGDQGLSFRPIGFFNHPNPLADYLVLLLPTPLCFVLLGRAHLSARAWYASLAVLVVGIAMLVATLSRGGWVCFGFATALIIAAYWLFGRISSRMVAVGSLMVALLIPLALVAVPSIWLRITGPDSRSNESRQLLAQQAYMMIGDHPFGGVGFGAYNRVARNYNPPGFATVGPDYHKSLRNLVVHNHYLLLAAELGVPATAFFLCIFAKLLWPLTKIRRWADPSQFALAVGLGTALAGNLLFLSSDNYYADIRMSMLWLVAGLLQALQLRQHGHAGVLAPGPTHTPAQWPPSSTAQARPWH